MLAGDSQTRKVGAVMALIAISACWSRPERP
jgi:hypothetical protein